MPKDWRSFFPAQSIAINTHTLKGEVFDAVRTTADLKDFTKSAILIEDICIDFQKAFDTVSRELMFRTLASLALVQGLFKKFMLFITMFLVVS